MSEKEKLQRSAYQQQRRKMILRLAIVVAVLTVILLGVGTSFIRSGGSNYIFYTEEGSAVYKAYLKDNEFYSEEYLNGSHAYVAALVDRMTADFSYDFVMEEIPANCSYSYRITAQLEVLDKASQMAIFNPVYPLKDSEKKNVSGNCITIQDSVELDYNSYNQTAKAFIAAYDLNNVEASLVVRMTVNTEAAGGYLTEKSSKSYTIALHVPLAQKTIAPYVETPPAASEQKFIAADRLGQGFLKVLTISFAVLDILAAAALAIYVVYTRDKHIDYARKVSKILSNYRSFVQKVNNPFDAADHQVLRIDSFPELLEIRDTLQSPVLMYENEDQTCTEFFIISSGILYSYKICVGSNRFGGRYSAKQTTEV